MNLVTPIKRGGEPVAVACGAELLESGAVRCGLLFVQEGQRVAVLTFREKGGSQSFRLRLPRKLLGRGHTCTYGAHLEVLP